MLTKEQEVEIGVLAKQGLSQRAIARLTGHSRNTVQRYLQGGPEVGRYTPRPAAPVKIDPYADYLRERIAAAAPDWIPATVLHREIAALGFEGNYETTKRFLRTLKPAKAADPIVRFETAPGEQMQFDWATIRRGKDRLVMFIATLGWSRASFVHFAEDETLPTLITAMEAAFDSFGGVPKTALTDNMKVVVDQRDAYGLGLHRYNPAFLDFARHCGFAIKLCKPYRAKTKGKVERLVRYVRGSFFLPLASRLAPDSVLVDAPRANYEVRRWLDEVANVRIHATTGEAPQARLARERADLLPVPPPWRGAIAPARPKQEERVSAKPQAPSLQRPLAVYDALVSWEIMP